MLTRVWQQWVVPEEGSLVTLLCGLSGTKDTSTFNPPMTKRDYSDPTPFSSVVARHRLMDAAMKISAKLLIPLNSLFSSSGVKPPLHGN